jgi:oligopeptide/dipeptide ABC transporter ATP-binding protein
MRSVRRHVFRSRRPSGPATRILNNPLHRYTALLDSAPLIGEREESIFTSTELPDALAPPPAFAPRCNWASSICWADRSELDGERDEHRAAYHRCLQPKSKQESCGLNERR